MTTSVQSATSLTFSGSNPASQNLTVPSSNKATVVAISGYSGSGWAVSSLTLDSNAPANFFSFTGDSLKVGAYIAVWFDVASGTRALDPAFNSAPSEGPLCQICYIGADGTLSFIDADAIAETDTTTASITLTSNTGDFVLAHAQKFGSAPTHNGTDVSGGSQSNADEFGQLFTLTAGASSTTATAANNYSSVSGIVLRESGGGGGGAFGPRRALMGVGRRKPERPEWARRDGGRIYTRRAA